LYMSEFFAEVLLMTYRIYSRDRAFILAIITILLLTILPRYAFAVSFHPETAQRMREQGTLEQAVRQMMEARERGVWAPADKSRLLTLSSDDTPDTMRIILILVDFSDNPWQNGPDGTPEFFEDLLFSQDVLEYGSMKEFYLENSYGNFVLTGEVVGWYRMPQTYAYYVDGQAGFGEYPQNAQKLTEDAVNVADPDVDFSLYDNDGDGWVEGLIIAHAGPGRETSGSNNHIHSHRWRMYSPQVHDGVTLYDYAQQPEEAPYDDGLVDIGVFCHEFGHVLGLPDLYDTDYSSSGCGNWSLMASGSWNGNGAYPAHFDAWCKVQLGFVDPDVLTVNEFGHEFPQVEQTPSIARLWYDGTVGPEYFLVENRQRVGFDLGIPGAGLVIYHVDENQSGNQNENHYLVAVEQADGRFDLEHNSGSGDGSDCWPGYTDAREFTDLTVPDTRSYGGMTTEAAVWEISDSDSLMTANLDVTYSRPKYILDDIRFVDSTGGDGDGIYELGETIDVFFTVTDIWAEALDAQAAISAADQRLNIIVPMTTLGTIPSGGNADNYGSPLRFEIPADMDTLKVKFYLTLTQSSYSEPTIFEIAKNVGGVKILLVDADAPPGDTLDAYYTKALDSLDETFRVWDYSELGTPTDKGDIPIIIWFTGNVRPETLTESDRTLLKQHMDSGGRLFLTGQDIAEHMAVNDPEMLNNYFKCDYGGSYSFQSMAFGRDGSEIGRDSIKIIITNPDDGASNQDSPDYLTPLEGDVVCFEYGDENAAGLEIDGGSYRAVLFGFGFEAINSTYTSYGYATRVDVMSRIIEFLSAPPFVCGDVTEDLSVDIDDVIFLVNYIYQSGPAPVPFNAGDVNCDAKVDLLDIVVIVNYLFRAGPVPCSACP
jgi:M6 family metalloprotease-like protein